MDLHIGLPEALRRVFWAPHYARRRLLSEHAAPFAPAHYALIGERRGYRPNGFFDPHYFRKRASGAHGASGGLLERYLAEPGVNATSPSAEFDHPWYMSQNPDWSRTDTHPFLHFLEHGMPAGKRPRPDIDVEFLRDVIRGKGRSLEEAAFRVFDPLPRDAELPRAQPAGIEGAAGPFFRRRSATVRARVETDRKAPACLHPMRQAARRGLSRRAARLRRAPELLRRLPSQSAG